MSTWKPAELDEVFEGGTCLVTAKCHFTSELVGGVPADDKALEAFCEHHLHLAGDELAAAVARIKCEELCEDKTKPDPAGTNEVKERESYGVNMIRHDDDGCCWLANWQVKACLKQTASRLGYFMSMRGSKGNMSELGQVRSWGISAGADPQRIRLLNPDGTPYVGNVFAKFMGRVNTPMGEKSIVHDSEVAPSGTRFELQFRMPSSTLTEDQIASIFAAARVVGLGSAKALERGKFEIDELNIVGVTAKKGKA